MEKKRYGTFAVLLHLLAPGLGFLYIGRVWLAILLPVLLLLFILFMGWSRLILTAWGVWAIALAIAAVYLIVVPWVFLSARRRSPQSLGHFQHGFVYLAFAIILLSISSLILQFRGQLLGYETFRLPSNSMLSTLLPNDFIVVDTWVYEKREPQPGDILVFKYPRQPEMMFTKRLIAKAGDTVEIRDGTVLVNQQAILEPYVLAKNNVKTSTHDYPVKLVEPGYFFVLGDNRDASNDSRVWGGLRKSEVYGKATAVWFSISKNSIRLSRIRSLVD